MHRVHSKVVLLLRDGEHIHSIFSELITKEHVSEVDLTENIDKVEYLTGEKFHEIGSTSSIRDVVIFPDELHALTPAPLVHEGSDVGETGGDQLHDAALCSLP